MKEASSSSKVFVTCLFAELTFSQSSSSAPTLSYVRIAQIPSSLVYLPLLSVNEPLAMWQQPKLLDDPFTTPTPETPPSTTFKWANRGTRPTRFSRFRFTPFKVGVALLIIGSLVVTRDRFPGSGVLVCAADKPLLDSTDSNRLSKLIETFPMSPSFLKLHSNPPSLVGIGLLI